MKLYIITEAELQYNDEYYHPTEGDAGHPVAAFKVRENAEAECRRRTEEKRKKYEAHDFSDGETPTLFLVESVEVADKDVVGYSEKLAAKRKAAEEAASLAKAHLSEQLGKVFVQYPDLLAVRWNQYTPHFNDGDKCVFSVWDAYIKLATTKEDEGDYEDGFVDGWRDEDPLTAPTKAVRAAIASLDEEDMQHVFGDHVQVTASRDGTFAVDEYEHD